ncbi:hypothetical protein J7337_010220 [Fusarium musae]|uniref:beta-glucosidase n=1 Tax=Fusarium musae TaxID=1042133 RepID=A0A9P8IL23_9HYPO|nr:hypothetical protein J7337_010220 [Fusarium musae]KAG9497360.1 hypothetical protein J7337_010220 [Fusarium musae]
MSPFMSEERTDALDVDELLSKLTIDEKISLLSGKQQLLHFHHLWILTLGLWQARTSGTQRQYPNTASRRYASRTDPTRGPLGGRGFESFSEDPVLSGHLAGFYCRGLQQENIAATLKHFVCNDMEDQRMAVNLMVTQCAPREIYLLPFQLALSIGDPQAVMTAYNQVNGTHVSENKELLQSILRDEWKFDGLAMSDWFGTYSTTGAIDAGLDLEMPGPSR